ncbi:hypothetical protein ABMY35_00885 [Pseudoalteromonas sp. BZB3]|uniref:hypothetical protein n=1 Tax=Pseudoalteromonas sp. BZB3 TaxID=3136670 RepID=UPI0032C45D80
MSYAITAVTAQLFILLLTLITNKVAATTLSLNDYAIYGQFVLMSSLISSFCTPGLQNSIMSTEVKKESALKVYFILATIISALLYFLIKIGSIKNYFLIDVESYISPLFILLIPFLYQAFVYKQAKVVNSGVRKNFIFFNVGNAFLCSLVLVLTMYFEAFVLTFLFLLLRPGFLGLLSIYDYLKNISFNINFKCIFDFSHDKKNILGYLCYGVVSTSSFYIYSSIARFTISESYDLETVGYFYTAQRIFELLLGFSLAYYSNYYFRKLSTTNDVKLLCRTVFSTSLYSALFFTLIAFIILFFSKDIVLLLFSVEQLPATKFFEPLLVNMILGSLVYSIGFALVAKANKFTMTILELLYLFAFCIFTLLFDAEYVVWIFPLIMLVKLTCNYFMFYRVFYARKV